MIKITTIILLIGYCIGHTESSDGPNLGFSFSSKSSSSKSSSSESSSSKSSESDFSNSANQGQFDKVPFYLNIDENMDDNVIVKRVWIAKKAIDLWDEHIQNLRQTDPLRIEKKLFYNSIVSSAGMNHWAIIMELSNDNFVLTQFGVDGTSLEIINESSIMGKLAKTLSKVWGKKDIFLSPLSFCFLGNSGKKFNEIYMYLRDKKIGEMNYVYYNLITNNCQTFCVDVEKKLFGKTKAIRWFDDDLENFIDKYFPETKVKEWVNNYLYIYKLKIFILELSGIDKETLSNHYDRFKRLREVYL